MAGNYDIWVIQNSYGFSISFNCTDSTGAPIDLTSATSVKLKIWSEGSSTDIVNATCTIASPTTSGIVTYLVQSTDFTVLGIYNLQVVIYGTGLVDPSWTYHIAVLTTAPV